MKLNMADSVCGRVEKKLPLPRHGKAPKVKQDQGLLFSNQLVPRVTSPEQGESGCDQRMVMLDRSVNMRGAMFIDVSSWNSSLAAYGM